MDPFSDYFESALSSMVSSPSASNSVISTDNFMMRELIGKLGNICNSNDLPNYINSNNCSTNTSCYTTPLSSPPKNSRSMPIIDHFINENFPSLGNSIGFTSNLPAMPSDPGFAERAAMFSSFGSASFNGENENLQRVFIDNENGSNKKRKQTFSKRKVKEFEPHSQIPTNSNKGNVDGSNAKRSRSNESKGKKGGAAKAEENKEPPKDYIHVRARRGQATDSHSLAERVRREKISERMKFLQDLVPGCNRVTGKALMLDEIINYVQSLQRQVEFLSMKLSTVNSEQELNLDNLFANDEMKPNWGLTHPMYQTMVPNEYGESNQNFLQESITTAGATPSCSLDPLFTTLNHHYLPKLPSLSNGDLQSIFEMRFDQKESGFRHQKSLNNGQNPREMKKEI